MHDVADLPNLCRLTARFHIKSADHARLPDSQNSNATITAAACITQHNSQPRQQMLACSISLGSPPASQPNYCLFDKHNR